MELCWHVIPWPETIFSVLFACNTVIIIFEWELINCVSICSAHDNPPLQALYCLLSISMSFLGLWLPSYWSAGHYGKQLLQPTTSYISNDLFTDLYSSLIALSLCFESLLLFLILFTEVMTVCRSCISTYHFPSSTIWPLYFLWVTITSNSCGLHIQVWFYKHISSSVLCMYD